MSIGDRLRLASSSTHPGDRAGILNHHLMMNEIFPSPNSEERIAAWVDRFEHEEEIEKGDPDTVAEAITRVVEDVDLLFRGMKEGDIRCHFFSGVQIANPFLEARRPTLEEHKAQWMTRWIEQGPGGRKRRNDEWSKLVGFTGEYLVALTVLAPD